MASAVVAVGKVRGVNHTLATLRAVPTRLDRQAIADVYPVAKQMAAAMRASIPRRPLSHMDSESPVRAVAEKGRLIEGGSEWRLASVRMYAPVGTVMADMAAFPRKSPTFVPNLYGKHGGPSRWVWPTAERFTTQLFGGVELARRRTEIRINAELRRVA